MLKFPQNIIINSAGFLWKMRSVMGTMNCQWSWILSSCSNILCAFSYCLALWIRHTEELQWPYSWESLGDCWVLWTTLASVGVKDAYSLIGLGMFNAPSPEFHIKSQFSDQGSQWKDILWLQWTLDQTLNSEYSGKSPVDIYVFWVSSWWPMWL